MPARTHSDRIPQGTAGRRIRTLTTSARRENYTEMAITLYSSRDLDFIEFDSNYGSPFLLLPKAEWYWLVDVKFCAWAYRVTEKARKAGMLTADIVERFKQLRAYARERFGDECNAVPALAENPVDLAPIPADFFREGFRSVCGIPIWPSFETDERKWRDFNADREHDRSMQEWFMLRSAAESQGEQSIFTGPSRDASGRADKTMSPITNAATKRKIVKSDKQKPQAPDSPSLFD